MDDLIAFVNAMLDEREEIAKAALVRNAGEWSLLSDLEGRGWWNEGRDPVLLVGGKPLATFNEEYGGFLVAYHVLANDPKAVLDDIAAKRQIIDLHQRGGEPADALQYCSTCGSGEPYEYPTEWPCKTLKFLALPFASHPDYREEWRP